MKPYKLGRTSGRRWVKTGLFFIFVLLTIIIGGYYGVTKIYQHNLQAVDSNSTEPVTFTISAGQSSSQIAEGLKEKQLIRSARAFVQYVNRQELATGFIAGTYKLAQSMDVQQIVQILTEGSVADDLFTIYPGNNLSQIKLLFQNNTHYTEEEIERALDRGSYSDHPLMADLPAGASLEGFIFPDSYQFISSTTPETIIRQALDEMAVALSEEIRAGITSHGLSIYEGVILASIVEKEVGDRDITGQLNDNRAKVAQVFLKRLEIGMMLQSNATDDYPAEYDTYSIPALPPSPISNVSVSALKAVAQPASTNYLYFVAGKDCITRFSESNSQHEALKSAHGVADPGDDCRG